MLQALGRHISLQWFLQSGQRADRPDRSASACFVMLVLVWLRYETLEKLQGRAGFVRNRRNVTL